MEDGRLNRSAAPPLAPGGAGLLGPVSAASLGLALDPARLGAGPARLPSASSPFPWLALVLLAGCALALRKKA